MAKLLLVEDDTDLAGRVVQWLQMEKYLVEHVVSGAEAIEQMSSFTYDLVILDLGLPDLSGIEVLQNLRAAKNSTPVLILTGRGEVEQKIQGLDSGADDYLTKPFDLRELSARIRTVLRRPKETKDEILKAGSIELDTQKHIARVDGNSIKLQPKELSLLEYLMTNMDRVVSTDEILNRVWNSYSDATSETIYTHIKNLRKKLKNAGAGKIIKTVHSAGYIIESDGVEPG